MSRCAILLLAVACAEEAAKVEIVDEPVAPEPVRALSEPVARTTSTAEPPEEEPRRRKETKSEPRAIQVRSELLARRKELAQKVRAIESRIEALEAKLKVTGPRNEQRDVLRELGRSRGELAKVRETHARCEHAFESDEWTEIDEAWILANDLIGEEEKDAAEENFQRFIELATAFRVHCRELEPFQGAR